MSQHSVTQRRDAGERRRAGVRSRLPAFPHRVVHGFIYAAGEGAGVAFAALEVFVQAEHELAVGVVDIRERILVADHDIGLEAKTGGFGLVVYPGERAFGQGMVTVTAADVGVRTDKPALLDLDVLRLAHSPHRRREVLAVLVDSERVIGVVYDLAEFGIVPLVVVAAERHAGGRDAETADRVPHADEADASFLREAGAERRGLGIVRMNVLVAVQVVGLLDQTLVRDAQDAALADHARAGAGRG